MSASPLSLLGSPSRSLEWLGGPGALLSSTALSTGDLGSLGPITSLIEGAAGAGSGETGPSPLPDALTAPANRIVLDTHAQLETVGHEVAPTNGPLHALTATGETLGLGHLGEGGNLLTDLGGVAANPTDPGTLAPVLTDAGSLATAANGLVGSVAAAPAAGNGLVGDGSVLAPAETILNQAVLDTHVTLEDAGHQIPVLNAPVHAVTGLGETLGLGHLGEGGTLLTDLSALPGTLLGGGGLSSANPVLADLGSVLGATDTLVGSVTGTLAGPLADGGLLAPVTNLANTGILDLHASLETIGHEVPLLNDTLHGLTGLGETAGLGHLGEGGHLLTDVANLPGALVQGEGLSALSPILSDAGAVTGAVGGLLGGVTGLAGGLAGGLDGAQTPLGGTGALLGQGAPAQPVADLGNQLIDGVHANLEQVGHDTPLLNEPIHAVIGLGNTLGLGDLGETSNLLTDAANLPGALVGGTGTAALGQVVADAGHGVEATGGVVGSLTGLLADAGSGAAGNSLGGLLGGLTGGTGGDAAGAHPLVDVSAGPATATPAADLAIVSPGTDSTHTVEASALTAPAGQPGLLSAALLTGDHIAFPQTGDAGDSLVGQLHDLVPVATAAPAEAGVSHDLMADLGLASLDLGGHAQAAQPDPMAHGTTTGLHLLGL